MKTFIRRLFSTFLRRSCLFPLETYIRTSRTYTLHSPRKRGETIGGGDRKCLVRAIDHFRFDASGYVARYRQSMIARSCYKIDRTAQFSHYRESEDNHATLSWIPSRSSSTRSNDRYHFLFHLFSHSVASFRHTIPWLYCKHFASSANIYVPPLRSLHFCRKFLLATWLRNINSFRRFDCFFLPSFFRVLFLFFSGSLLVLYLRPRTADRFFVPF